MAWSTPATWVAGIPTVANFNARIRDQFNSIGDPWTAYAPAWTATGTAPAPGNGTLTGAYTEWGKFIHYRIEHTMGSTSTYGTGSYRWSIPVSMKAAATSLAPCGAAILFDTSAALRYSRNAGYITATTIALFDDATTSVAQTAPFTWATGDILVIQGFYEGA